MKNQSIFYHSTTQQAASANLGGNLLDTVGNVTSKPFDLSGAPKAPGSGDFTADRDAATQNIILRNQPMMDRQRAALETQLANQGVPPTSLSQLSNP